jgi:predicted lipoprotein with Yx(FWY)xxD motif
MRAPLRFSVAALVALVVAVGLAACGSGGSTSSSGTTNQAAAGGAYGGGGTAAAATTSSTAAATSSAADTSAAGAPVALITTKHSKLGTILASGPKRLTVYLFEADKGAASTCSGACAKAWPPVLGRPQAKGAVSGHGLGTIRRPDGSTQVTYHGHPLYTFVKDEDDGDAYGQGSKEFGAEWYALRPSGEAADNS